MAKMWNKGEWEDELIRIAKAAADDYMSKINTEGMSKETRDATRNWYIRTGVAKMKKDFGFSLSDKDKNTVSNWDAKDASRYLFNGGNKLYRDSFNPILKKRMDDFAKLGPLVLGLADEGRDWYSMGAVDLFDAGQKLGYDTKSKEGRMDFLRDVGEVQMAHDRGKLLEEFDQEYPMWAELFYPTLAEEYRKQISTGIGTQEQLDKAKVLDLVANSLIALFPAAGDAGAALKASQASAAAKGSKILQALGKNRTLSKTADFLDTPIVSGVIGAAGQGAAEGDRQLLKEGIDPELEADYTNALFALTLGATRPGMIGSASALVSQLPGAGPSRFAAGISAATRAGNPVVAERNALKRAFDKYSKLFRNQKENPLDLDGLTENQRALLQGTNYEYYTLPELKAIQEAKALRGKANALYGKPTNAPNRVLDEGREQEFLKDYDNLADIKVGLMQSNGYEKPFSDFEIVNRDLLPIDYLPTLEQAFPAKMAEAYGNDMAYKTGLRAGELLGMIGGSLEPAYKANPISFITGGERLVDTDYRETPWYKRMNKRQREAFDDAYEKSKKSPSE